MTSGVASRPDVGLPRARPAAWPFAAYWHWKWGTAAFRERLAAIRSFGALEDQPRAAATLERLQHLLTHAAVTSPFHAQRFAAAGFRPGDLQRLEDLRLLPVMTKDDVREHADQIVSSSRPRESLRANATGGSTGKPVRFYQDDDYWEWARATETEVKSWWGIAPWDKTASLWGADRDIPELTPRERLYLWLNRERFLNSFALDPVRMRNYAAMLQSWRPEYVKGYAGSLRVFAEFLLEEGRELSAPRAIRSSAEVLTAAARATIENAFGAPVYDFYGSREINNIAAQCEAHGGLHVLAFNRVVEIVDDAGRPCAPGEPGRVVVTDLTNLAMPFIRYANDDVATLGPPACPCGRRLPLIAAIQGRTSDFFIAPGGGLVHGEYFTHLFYGIAGVLQFQLRQTRVQRVEIAWVGDDRFDEAARRPIEAKIRERLGAACEVFWTKVADIPPTASGKRRFTISEVERATSVVR